MKIRLTIFSFMFLIIVSGCSPAQNTPIQQTETPIPATVEPTTVPTAAPTATITSSPTPVPLTPMDLLGEELNPFYQLNIPQEFTFDKVSLWDYPEMRGYTYELTSKQTVQDTITLIGGMVTIQDIIIEDKLKEFQNSGQAWMESEYNGREIFIKVEDREDYLSVQFQCHFDVETWQVYEPYFEKNFNIAIFPSLEHSLFDDPANAKELTISPNENQIDSIRQYILEDTEYELYKNYYSADSFLDTISRNSLEKAYTYVDGNRIGVNGEQNFIDFSFHIEDNEIWVFESVQNLDKSLTDYTEPSITPGSLINLGFDDMNIDEGVVGIKDEEYDNRFFLMIKKTEWGAEQDLIEVVSGLIEKYHLTYNVSEKKFYLDMQEGDYFVKLIYDSAANEITLEDPNLSMEYQEEAIQQLTGMEFEEGSKWLVSRTTDFVKHQFGLTMDELFEAPLQ